MTKFSGPYFSGTDYYELSKDGLNRFVPSVYANVSYALVTINQDGNPVSYQFEPPNVTSYDCPGIKKLKSISLGDSSQNVIKAMTEDNIEMRALRVIKVKTQTITESPKKHLLFFFYPATDYTAFQNLKWPLLNTPYVSNADAEQIFNKIETRSHSIRITHDSVTSRHYHSNTSHNENVALMQCTAIEAYNEFHEQYSEKLPESFHKMTLKSLRAEIPYNLKSSLRSFQRPEWCHVIAKSLYPSYGNPQIADNIVAAPFWINSQMMIMEDALRWHAKTYLDLKINLTNTVQLFHNTKVLATGKMKASIRFDITEVSISQYLDPFQIFPAYPQATDIGITTFVINTLLLNHAATVIDNKSNDAEPAPVRSAFDNIFECESDDEIEQIMSEIDEAQFLKSKLKANASPKPIYDEIENIMFDILNAESQSDMSYTPAHSLFLSKSENTNCRSEFQGSQGNDMMSPPHSPRALRDIILSPHRSPNLKA